MAWEVHPTDQSFNMKDYRMKNFFLVGIATALISTPISAQSLPDSYQTVCRTESMIGYSWRNGEYVIARYEPSTYTIEVGDTGRCRSTPIETITEKIRWRNVCAIITRVGEARRPELTAPCREVYISDGRASSVSLECKKLIGESVWADPDGIFHVSMISPDTASKPRNDYKDSLSLGVGTCRRTN